MFRLVGAILLLALVSAAVFKEEDGVLVLTKSNFQEGIKTHKNILVEFYAPWCGHCQTLAPEYAKAAALLADKKSPIKLAKVDATEEEDLAETYDVQGYPTLQFFRNSVPTEYTGERSARKIVDWVMERQIPEEAAGRVHTLTTQESLQAFISDHERTLIAYCTDPNSPLVKMFTDVASTVKDHTFGLVQDATLFNSSEAEDNTIYIHKQKPIGLFDPSHVQYPGGNNVKELQDFITSESFPVILEMNIETAHYIFDSKVKTHVLLFISKNNGDFESVAEGLMGLAKEVRERNGAIIDKSILFIVVDTDEADHEKLVRTVGLKKGSRIMPAVRIIKLGEKGDIAKFKPEQDTGYYLNPEIVKQFVDNYLEDKLQKYLLTEDLPSDWDKNPVKVLVSSNFDDIAFDKEKTVLVQFYSPSCGYCHQFAPIYDQVGKVFAEKFDGGRDVVIAKIDATANELEHTKITLYPSFKLYKKATNKVVDFTGERTLEALVKFVETGGKSVEKEDETLHSKDEL